MTQHTTSHQGAEAPQSIASFSTLTAQNGVTGRIIDGKGGARYEIDGVERMEPFLMTLASDSDHWLFILSNGGLTAGRGDPDGALFPYYTQDKLMAMSGTTGSRTIIRTGGKAWEPYGPAENLGGIRRKVRKSYLGNRIELEETLEASALTYRLTWRPSERFGFVRMVDIVNNGEEPVDLEILDGMLNVLPAGLSQRFQNEFSILGDAYKQSELIRDCGMALYHLSSVPTDLAEPMESLKATVVWQSGPPVEGYLLSESAVKAFINGTPLPGEDRVRGRHGAYLTRRRRVLEPGQRTSWYTCADVNQDLGQVESLREWIRGCEDAEGEIEADCARTEDRLRRMLADADGLQCTREKGRCLRHTSNTLFNLMRGGAFMTGYALPTGDLIRTVRHFNTAASKGLEDFLKAGTELTCKDPWDPDHPVRSCGSNVLRLLREYLPLSFSRRHGDPSRPWNRFSIRIREADGSPRFYYEGNWRDIFQNWEALLQAYPEYCEAAICRFLNASSADGYNPYRLNKEGFEWERPEPGDPWANIGYWGDHQIIYLLRLLENSVRFHPGRLAGLLHEETFVYAEIPYRIHPFSEILRNPRSTVDFDEAWEARIGERIRRTGADGKLMPGEKGDPRFVNLMEKLLVPLLAKLANFIPGGGIWMNTQRPEWNDANNALVGFGVSVVTLGYIARYLRFLLAEFGGNLRGDSYLLSAEITGLLLAQQDVFTEKPAACSGSERLEMMRRLGEAASTYREGLYGNGLSGRKASVDGREILAYLESALAHVECSLRENKRADGLWHSYNLLEIAPDSVGIKNLFVMLEGQVSILSSGMLEIADILTLLESLRNSPLYREDQDSYILYPNRESRAFLEKNRVAAEDARAIPSLKAMLDKGDTRVIRSLPSGEAAFNGAFHNAGDVSRAIADIPGINRGDREAILNLFEKTFNHHAFTGRSGTFFAYEGLGSIYWHMVSKLALAVQEAFLQFKDSASAEELEALLARFREIRNGLGVDKNPAHYGAIPTDAYSHTPAHTGAQQPGMTGQVKEDILVRLNELGVRIREGCLAFDTCMLEDREFLTGPSSFEKPSVNGEEELVSLPEGSLAFSFCGVPVVYGQKKPEAPLRVVYRDGTEATFDGTALPESVSAEVFNRSPGISRIEVSVPGGRA